MCLSSKFCIFSEWNQSNINEFLEFITKFLGNIKHGSCCIAMNTIHTHIQVHADSQQRHNKDERHNFLEKIYLSLYWKGCVWEGVGGWTELQHIDPHSYGHNSVSFPFSWAAQRVAWGPSLSGTCPSFQHLLCNCNCSIGARGPPLQGASFLYRIISPTHLNSNCWLPVFTRIIQLFDVHLLLVGVTNRTHSTRLRSRLYPDTPRPEAPVIYTGAFPFLTAWLGSICYTVKLNLFIHNFQTRDCSMNVKEHLENFPVHLVHVNNGLDKRCH